MTSKAERHRRRRRAREAADPFALAPTPRREPSGRPQRTRDEADPQHAQLAVRCRHAGLPPTDANLRDAKAPWKGCEAGKVIDGLPEEECRNLWDAIQHMLRVITAHDAAYGKPRRHPVCLRLLAPVDAMEADASSPPLDDRSDADKQRQADAALMKLETWLGHTNSTAASVCKRVVWNDEPCRRADRPLLLAALRCVDEGRRGQPIVFRSRVTVGV